MKINTVIYENALQQVAQHSSHSMHGAQIIAPMDSHNSIAIFEMKLIFENQNE